MKRQSAFLLLLFLLVHQLGWSQLEYICPDTGKRSNEVKTDVEHGTYLTNQLWPVGQVLKVKFLDDASEKVRTKVMQYAHEWEKHADFRFEFVNQGPADIRISFRQKGASWSYIGTTASTISADQPTMNFGWFDDTTPEQEFSRTVLHEFGHALGLVHEHHNPNSGINWNRPKVMGYYTQILGWSPKRVEDNVFGRYSEDQTNEQYDPHSIMHYPIPTEFTLDGYSTPINTSLSDKDKALISKLYPSAKASITSLTAEHNVVQDGRKGIRIKVSFEVEKAKDTRGDIELRFANKDGSPLLDKNGQYKSYQNCIGITQSFTIPYHSTKYTDVELFIPNDELDISEAGEYNLMFYAEIWVYRNNHWKELAESNHIPFIYQKGAHIANRKVEVEVEYNVSENGKVGMRIWPKFTAVNSKEHPLNVAAYFYFDDATSTPLKDLNNVYKAENGNVAVSTNITPGYDAAYYQKGNKGVSLFIPCDELHIDSKVGTQQLKFYIVVWDGKREIATSNWEKFSCYSVQAMDIK